MSYDIRIGVKVEGLGQIVECGMPRLDEPTYNLGAMFRACTGWDFKQGEWYKCSDVFENINHGIAELAGYPKKYLKYEPDNGWGNVNDALRVLESLRECIEDREWEIPLEYLWVKW